MLKQEQDHVVFNGGVSHSILPVVNGGKLPQGATPKVQNATHFTASATAPITVTDLRFGAAYQSVDILGDGNTTIANNTTIKTNTGANKLLALNKVYRFTFFNGVWYEDA